MLKDFLKPSRFVFLSTFFFLTSCTLHQEERIRELLTVSQGPFQRQKALHTVSESLAYPSSTFSLEIQAADPLTTAKGQFPLILLKGDQIPLGERFIFATIDPLTQKIDPRFEFEVLSNGYLQIFDRQGIRIEKHIPFVDCEGLLLAKPVLYAVVSKASYTSATAEFIPYPLTSMSATGASIELQVNHPLLTRFACEAKGLEPQEKIILTHQSADHKEEFELIADAEGKIALPLNPTILGKLGGHASVSLKRAQEELRLEYPWGAKLEKQTYDKQTQFPVLFVVNSSLNQINSEIVQNSFASTPSLQ